MNYHLPELRHRLASEYVLGTLHGRARKRFLRLLPHDADLRDAVAFWEAELMPMASVLSSPAPRDQVWQAIAGRISPATPQHKPAGWFERWFSLAMLRPLVAGLVLGIGLMLLAPLRGPVAPAEVSQDHVPQSYAGFLQDANGNLTALVSSLRYGKLVDVKLVRPVQVSPDRALQLWALPAGSAPVWLGTIPSQGKGTLTLPDTSEALLSKVTELAVSSEPKSNTAPSQPPESFLLRGPCGKFW